MIPEVLYDRTSLITPLGCLPKRAKADKMTCPEIWIASRDISLLAPNFPLCSSGSAQALPVRH